MLHSTSSTGGQHTPGVPKRTSPPKEINIETQGTPDDDLFTEALAPAEIKVETLPQPIEAPEIKVDTRE